MIQFIWLRLKKGITKFCINNQMKNFTLILSFLLLLSCCKKTTMKDKVYNPVTGEGIAGIGAYVLEEKSGSQVHIVAEYEQCNDFKRGSFHNEGDNAETREKHSATEFSTDPEKILKDRVRIYPNPGTTMFWIESIQEQNLKNILVHDLRGTQITKVKCSEQKQLINTENWQLGIYIVTIELEDGTLINQNFIKL